MIELVRSPLYTDVSGDSNAATLIAKLRTQVAELQKRLAGAESEPQQLLGFDSPMESKHSPRCQCWGLMTLRKKLVHEQCVHDVRFGGESTVHALILCARSIMQGPPGLSP